MILATAERYIGLVGLANSGKSVLLTSLMDHLKHHEPDRFRLGRPDQSVHLRKVRQCPAASHAANFDYALARQALGLDHRWPRKTKDRYELHVRFERSDWSFTDVALHWLDLPGERLVDFPLWGQDYASWSDAWWRSLSVHPDRMSHFSSYRQALDASQSIDTWLTEYRLGLARTMLAHQSYVVPSVFWLDPQGTLPRGTTPETVAEGRFSGLANDEFAPLPVEVRSRATEIVSRFSNAFRRYQDELIQPFFADLSRCHALVILVDIVQLLQAGVGSANDFRQMLDGLFQVLQPGEALWERLSRVVLERVLQYRPRNITKLAFAVPKIDLVHPQDRDRLLGLLRQIVGPHLTDYDGVQTELFTLASVVSTTPIPGEPGGRWLSGRRFRDDLGQRRPYDERVKYPVSEVPLAWPQRWRPGEFLFPEVYPEVPDYQGLPANQIGLDRLLTFLLED